MVEYAGRPVMTLSPGKETRTGFEQVYRHDLHAGDVLEPVGVAADQLSTDLRRLPPEALK